MNRVGEGNVVFFLIYCGRESVKYDEKIVLIVEMSVLIECEGEENVMFFLIVGKVCEIK